MNRVTSFIFLPLTTTTMLYTSRIIPLLGLMTLVSALGQPQIVSFSSSPSFNSSIDPFPLVSSSHPLPSFVVSSDDFPGILRAAQTFNDDVKRVTGRCLDLLHNAEDVSGGGLMVIAGSLEQSTIVKRLVSAGKLDTSSIQGKWESYTIQVVDNPMDGVERALIVAGSE